ncbi:dihydrodipicolinate synthase family protein [Acinetobacter sp. B5B]|nr:dihydrodipicolinate synthase family protein [Acinetobacter baretiae]
MNIEGIIAYPITPFNQDGTAVDYDALTQTLEALIQHQSAAIAPLGSTGESAYLSWDEWVGVAKKSIDIIRKRVPVIIGISELTTAMAIKKAQMAQALGADAIMVIPISYWKLSDQEIYEYYQEIATATSLPIMVYNNPATSGIDMSPELLVKL